MNLTKFHPSQTSWRWAMCPELNQNIQV